MKIKVFPFDKIFPNNPFWRDFWNAQYWATYGMTIPVFTVLMFWLGLPYHAAAILLVGIVSFIIINLTKD